MSFEKYKNEIIENFIENLETCELKRPDKELTEEQLKLIHEELDNHENCFNNHKEDFDKESCDLMGSYIYGDNIATSIECNHCQEVIIDDEVI